MIGSGRFVVEKLCYVGGRRGQTEQVEIEAPYQCLRCGLGRWCQVVLRQTLLYEAVDWGVSSGVWQRMLDDRLEKPEAAFGRAELKAGKVVRLRCARGSALADPGRECCLLYTSPSPRD